ncbi:phosphatidyl inositol 3-kinase-like protein [Bombardia bombarda]|uniref:Serine/threonine-protein kinase MEC1 n=1 Tax=Bombardia bombarda TaxID=252184 RepID=A0AA39WCM0_9PEZI|nr:phosphatidyl inositol 3-kinase-like protein [Bombardia bombarda]
MAPEPYGNAPGEAGPPPSTLVAQLVENISTSGRSARPDETSELKRLMGIIENVKSNPDSIETQEKKAKHNHLLIYMCGKVVLESLKLEDSFADQAKLRVEVLKNINFLKVTLKETPIVLTHIFDDNRDLPGGKEPLWMWILPKVLKLLGHSRCLSISDVIEDLCQYILLLATEQACLWDLGPVLMRYFQTNLASLLTRFMTVAHELPQRAKSFEIELPSKAFMDSLSLDFRPQGYSLTILGLEQAVHHAIGLVGIIKRTVLPQTDARLSSFYGHNLVWLLDSLETLASFQLTCPLVFDGGLASVIQMTIQLETAAARGSLVGVDSIVCHKANATLVAICSEIFKNPQQLLSNDQNGLMLRRQICLALIQVAKETLSIKSEPISGLITSRLLNPAQRIVANNPIVGAETDVWRSVYLLGLVTATPPPSALSEDVRPDRFADNELSQLVKRLRLEVPNDQPHPPIAKRRKLVDKTSTLDAVVGELFRLVGTDPSTDAANLKHRLIKGFPNMDENKQCEAIDLVTRICCSADNTLEIARKRTAAQVHFQCSFCTKLDRVDTQPKCLDESAKDLALALFTKIIKLPSFTESRRPRVFAMIAMRRLVRHSRDVTLWDLEKSEPGQWCVQCLHSSIRELRIAAGRAFCVFLTEPPAEGLKDIIRRNRKNAMELLNALSDKDDTNLHETCIMAWGQVGKVTSDDELNLVLIKLVEYLGHRNMVVSAFAFSEILNLADSRGETPRRLFQPFWTRLAFLVVKDLVTRPQTTRMVAELLQTGVDLLLRGPLQKHALPWLVLAKKREVIQKIAEARGETESWQPILDNSNLPSIVALLLIQDAPDIAEYAMSMLKQISSHFDGFALVDLLRTEPLLIALELFKAGGGANEDRKARVRTALATMASALMPDNGQKKGKKPKKSELIGRYLQQHALGLAARLSEVINDTLGLHPPVQEQRQCIGAMEEMIRVCNSYVCIARPQISACLISALASDELRSAAFSCWNAMLTHMEEADVEALIETTFYIIGHYWNSFNDETRLSVKARLAALLKENTRQNQLKKDSGTLTNFANKLPSLDHIEELQDFCRKMHSLSPKDDNRAAFGIFGERLYHENPGVVEQALVELVKFLEKHQDYLQTSALSEQPDSVVTTLTRSLLDCSAKYNGWQPSIARLCAECIGLIGCLDSNRLEAAREQRQFVVVHNFDDASETTHFVAFLLENVLVKAFLSTTDTKLQGYLSFAMQELLERTDFRAACQLKGRDNSEFVYREWLAFSDASREVLTPFLTSRFGVAPLPQVATEYPIFRPGRPYASWSRSFVLDLLRNGQNPFSQIIFEPLCRLISVKDLAVTEFLLPYVALHVVVGQENSSEFRDKVAGEFIGILKHQPPDTASYIEREDIKLYYQAVFRILDYFMRWLQAKQSQPDLNSRDKNGIKWVKGVINALDPELISQRAIDCNEYARALFFLEPHLERRRGAEEDETSQLMQTIQDIYTHIDDPDGLEGVSARLQNVDLNQQALSHRKAGRWTAAQTWYEIQLSNSPEDINIQLDLLTCLKESGQHDALLNYVEGMKTSPATVNKLVPFAVEASWATGRWQTLEKYLGKYSAGDVSEVFNLGIAQALLCLRNGDTKSFKDHMQMMWGKAAGSLTYSTTSSLRACHDAMLKCHVLSDLEMIANEKLAKDDDQQEIMTTLGRRLEVLGAYVSDKQYLLGVGRAAMELLRPKFGNEDISSLWLSSARLARKSGSIHQSFNAVLHAQKLGDGSAIIENARLLYKEGHHRKAIQVLQLAISTNSFINDSFISNAVSAVPPTSSKNPETQRSMLTARAYLLLAKWLDSTGQTHASALRSKYQQAAKAHSQWEKGHYYLGRHYKKVLESEQTLKPDDQSDEFLTGETAKLVIENYLRSLNFGTKYLYQTLPRILTLWLELGAQVNKPPDGKVSISRELQTRRKDILQDLYKHFQKYLPRMPAYIFYTALPQIVARIAHPNVEVFKVLEQMILKVVDAHPRQALWSVFPFMTARQHTDRRARGIKILEALRELGRKVEGQSYHLKQLLRMGEKLAEQLLVACNNGEFQSNRTTTASITKDLHFNHKCTPCPLVVPIEACLTATLPTLTDNVRKHKAFSRDVITIDSFLDNVLVLGSLAKPRKLTARGTDGKLYGLLIKPKDDLRTDQRLMEFNSMINRSLKRDAESSRRQLYIKTYAVTPLNEECGIIEWVDGLKTLRDILLGLYKTRNISPNYGQIAQLMKEVSASEANIGLFTERVLSQFPPVLPDWFISQFPNPSVWFAARLKYTRSCAVMSMVGTILGLGDRHGENVLLEEGNGGIFHVDFNCLFDKGLTFAQPERVPFRLTHNMEAAMGIYGYEGPFRHSSELTLRILRQQEETLMTILEAFIHDPTLDLQKAKKKNHEAVKLNPTSVVESIKRKVRGLLPDESIPLGVEGQVEELIKQAVNPRNLASMYIGWCPFL